MNGVLTQFLRLSGLGAALVTLPGAVELLLLTVGASRRQADRIADRKSELRLAVLIPAHNEEFLISRCVASVFSSARQVANSAVIVVADNCTDGTARRAHDAGARVLVRQDPEHRGKGQALRFAFASLMEEGYEGFAIVDADSLVSPNLVPDIDDALRAGADAVQAGNRIGSPDGSTRNRLMDVAFLAFNGVRPRGRAGWGLSAGISGNGFAIGRQTLLDVPYTAESIVEDLEYHLLLVSHGKKVAFADRAAVYSEMPDDARARSSQRARWEGGRLRVAQEWIPLLARRVARGDLASLEPLLDLLSLPLAYQACAALFLCTIHVAIFRWYGAAVLAIVVVHLFSAVRRAERPLAAAAALISAPAYVVWKLATLPAMLRSSRRRADWVSTRREKDSISSR